MKKDYIKLFCICKPQGKNKIVLRLTKTIETTYTESTKYIIITKSTKTETLYYNAVQNIILLLINILKNYFDVL